MDLKNNWINPISDWSTDPEEAANTFTHGVGFLLSVLGAGAMAIQVLREGDLWRIAGCMVFTFSLVAVYATSALSHCCSAPSLKRFFRTLDQGFIYFLIVGTFTPFSLAFLRTTPWCLFLMVNWIIAIFGFCSKIFLGHRVDTVSVWIYVVLGWIPVAAAPALVGLVPAVGLWWMVVGGLCYTVGTVFLIFDRHVCHFHALWHLFVIAGSTCHFFVILRFVAPAE